MRNAGAGLGAAVALLISLAGYGQEVGYLHQFATRGDAMVADETGVYATVDATSVSPTGVTTLGKAITLRKFSLLSGAEEWSREIWSDANLEMGTGSELGMDFSGIYVAVSVPLSSLDRKAVVRKYHRNGSLLWVSELSGATRENVMTITVGNGVVYVMTGQPQTGNFLYRLDPQTGAVLTVTAAGAVAQVSRMRVGPGGIYTIGSVNPAVLRKYDLAGTPRWERTIGPGFTVGLALLAHPTGIYAGGQRGGTNEGFLERFDEDGNLTGSTAVAANNGGSVSIRDVRAAADGIVLTGTVTGGFPGLPQYHTTDVFARKQSFGGNAEFTYVFGSAGFTLTPSSAALAGDALLVYGLTSGTYPGNAPADGPRAGLARVNLPVGEARTLASVLAEIPSPAGNSLRNRAGAICTQLEGLATDIQRQRGVTIEAEQADLAVAKIGDVRTLMGCGQ